MVHPAVALLGHPLQQRPSDPRLQASAGHIIAKSVDDGVAVLQAVPVFRCQAGGMAFEGCWRGAEG
jgi:hypothetical protein